MNKSSSPLPFYFQPMDRKRSVQIIKETEAEIKKMESRRPSTPFNQRIFMPNNQYSGQKISRPSSCASIKSLKYEEQLCAPNIISSQAKSYEKASKDIDIKLEPIVTKPIYHKRKSSQSYLRRKSESDFSGFPALKVKDHSNYLTNSTEEKQLERIEQFEESFASINHNYNLLSESLNDLSFNEALGENSISVVEEEDQKYDKLSEDLSVFLLILEKNTKLGKNKDVDEIISAVNEISTVLKDNNAFQLLFGVRVYLLKMLFKLLDSNFPDLSITIIKLLLEMKVKDNNLSNVFRLTLKLMKEEYLIKFDDLFIDEILENMQEISIANNEGATMYAVKIIKRLVQTGHLEEKILKKCIVTIMHHLRETICFFNTACWDKNWNAIVIQIVSVLHCLCEMKNTKKILIDLDCLNQTLKLIYTFLQHADIIEISIRLISKVIDKEGSDVLRQCSNDLLLHFLNILEIYKYHIDIVLQTTFIIGSIVSLSAEVTLRFLSATDFMNIITNTLDDYVLEHIQFKENVSECFIRENSGDRNWHRDIFEVILKILCIWANVCLNPKAGVHLASQDSLILKFLSIINDYKENGESDDKNFAIYSFLVVLGNISYYLQSGSNMCIFIAERIIPFLDANFSHEVRLESANIVRNLTRHQEVREYVQESSLFQEIMKLVNENNKEMISSAYGIIMNLLIEQDLKSLFYEEEGVTRLLHKLHLCIDRDWKTSAILCQILWNCCCSENAFETPLSEIEIQHLVKLLSYTIYKEHPEDENEKTYDEEYKNHFYPVAKKLLELLQRKNFNCT